jgi:hypothetical protein
MIHTRFNGSITTAGLLLTTALLILLSGCKGGLAIVTVTPLPTIVPTVAVIPPTLPPSWTPGASPTVQSATNTPTVTFQSALGASGLSALPPTWTPSPVKTDTPVPIVTATEDAYRLTLTAFLPHNGPTINPNTPLPPTQEGTAQPPLSPLRTTFPATCAKFVADMTLTTRTMLLGSSATIVWKPTREANAYHLWLATTDGFYRYNTTVTGDRAVIPAKEFITAGVYGWELVAYIDFNPFCGHLTGVIVVKNG